MRGLALCLLVGCPWIDGAEHAEAQKVFDPTLQPTGGPTGATGETGFVPTDTDTDTDVDTDTDTDVDTDCVDDAFEDNDSVDDATFLTSGTSVEATLCPDDAPVGAATDAFKLVPGANDVVAVQVRGAATPCADMTMRAELRGADGELRSAVRTDGACPSFVGGGFGDAVVHALLIHEGGPSVGYELTLDTQACEDTDGDGYLAASCGGPDCDDDEPDVSPGANEVPGDGVDDDCDGGDALVPCDAFPPTPPTAEAGRLACGATDVEPVWDVYTLNLTPGACVGLSVDNLGGNADLTAVLVDPDGNRLTLTDEALCTGNPWTRDLVFPFDQGCPQGGGITVQSGVHTLWVSQVDGSGCTDDSAYGVDVWVDGVSEAPTPGGQGVVFAP